MAVTPPTTTQLLSMALKHTTNYSHQTFFQNSSGTHGQTYHTPTTTIPMAYATWPMNFAHIQSMAQKDPGIPQALPWCIPPLCRECQFGKAK